MNKKQIIFHISGLSIIFGCLLTCITIILYIFLWEYVYCAESNLIILTGELICVILGIIYYIYLVKIIMDKI